MSGDSNMGAPNNPKYILILHQRVISGRNFHSSEQFAGLYHGEKNRQFLNINLDTWFDRMNQAFKLLSLKCSMDGTGIFTHMNVLIRFKNKGRQIFRTWRVWICMYLHLSAFIKWLHSRTITMMFTQKSLKNIGSFFQVVFHIQQLCRDAETHAPQCAPQLVAERLQSKGHEVSSWPHDERPRIMSASKHWTYSHAIRTCFMRIYSVKKPSNPFVDRLFSKLKTAPRTVPSTA